MPHRSHTLTETQSAFVSRCGRRGGVGVALGSHVVVEEPLCVERLRATSRAVGIRSPVSRDRHDIFDSSPYNVLLFEVKPTSAPAAAPANEERVNQQRHPVDAPPANQAQPSRWHQPRGGIWDSMRPAVQLSGQRSHRAFQGQQQLPRRTAAEDIPVHSHYVPTPQPPQTQSRVWHGHEIQIISQNP